MSQASKCDVLVIDDLAVNRVLMQMLLELEGYSVTTAWDASSALAQLAAAPPALVLLDIMMPGLDGYALARRIRQDPRFVALPIVLVSACEHDDVLQRQALNIADFLPKPIEFQQLHAVIQAILPQSAAQLVEH